MPAATPIFVQDPDDIETVIRPCIWAAQIITRDKTGQGRYLFMMPRHERGSLRCAHLGEWRTTFLDRRLAIPS